MTCKNFKLPSTLSVTSLHLSFSSMQSDAGDAVRNPEALDDYELLAKIYSSCPSYSYADHAINISSTSNAAMPHGEP